MKLKECTYGRMVITDDKEIGFIKRLKYSVPIKFILENDLSLEEIAEITIPIVSLPTEDRAIHPSNLEPYE